MGGFTQGTIQASSATAGVPMPMQSNSLFVINFEVGPILLHLRHGSALGAGSIYSCYEERVGLKVKFFCLMPFAPKTFFIICNFHSQITTPF